MNKQVEVLAIIPARGGSKGIPRKNVRLLSGKPLIVHTIDNAKRSSYISKVVVSTDDPEIAQVSLKAGAEVVWRPADISGDGAASEAALLHALEYLKTSEGYEPDLTCFLQCTSPLTLPEDIDGTIQELLIHQADTALAVTPFHYFLWEEDSGDAVGINHDKSIRLLRQQRSPQYRETGAVYVMRTNGFLQAKHRFFGATRFYSIPEDRCHEIDEPIDFEIARIVLQERQQAEKLRFIPDEVKVLVLDFDGVFTDNKVIVFADGTEAVLCSRSDGWGIGQLRKLGLTTLVLSTEVNSVVSARANKLGIPCLQGIEDKLPALQEWLDTRDIDIEDVAYIGNDVNDLTCLKAVGCGIAVQDAHPLVKNAACIVLDSNGGDGAIRELTDLLQLKLRSEETDKWQVP